MENQVELPVFECLRCGHKWSPRKAETPLRCGACKSPYWKTPPEQGRISMGSSKKRKKNKKR
jgi:predicted Zn-ribbon and HTH transcriptional regulator